jgi:hypothetical protein
MTTQPEPETQEGGEKQGFFKLLQGGFWPYALLAAGLALAAYIIGYGMMQPGG